MFDSVLRSLLGKGQEQAYDPQLPGQKQLEQQQMPQQQWQMPSEWLALIMNSSDRSFGDTLKMAAAITQNQQKVDQENYELQMKQQEMLMEQKRAENVAALLKKPEGFSLADMLEATGGKNYMGAASLYEAANPKHEWRADESLPGGGYYVPPKRNGLTPSQSVDQGLNSTNEARVGDNLNNIDLNESPHERKLRQTRESERPKETFNQEDKLRDEFRNESKDWKIIDQAYSRIKASADNPSPAGDIALLFNFMKLLDPGSTVRESEYAEAANAANVPEKIRNLYNRAIDGTRLTQSMRQDFVKRSHKLYEAPKNTQLKLIKTYKELAKRNKLNPENIIVDFNTEEQNNASAPNSDISFRSKKLDALEAELKRRNENKNRKVMLPRR